MTPIKSNRAPLTKRISVLAITAAAALSFSVFSPTAEALPLKPTKEYLALKAQLPTGVEVDTATPAQLAQAVTDAILDPLNARLKPGNIAGEALKYAGTNGQDGGDEIGAALITTFGGDDLLAARDAIKRAGAGKDINVSLVPEFSTQFFNTNPDAYKLGKLVSSTKVGVGAVIAGRSIQIDQDGALNEAQQFTAQVALVNGALAPTKSNGGNLKAAALEITKSVVAEVDAQAGGTGNTAAFTLLVAKEPINIALAAKIGTGGVAGDPLNGGPIVDTLLNENSLPKLKSGIASFAKSVGAVADIEEISEIAVAIGNQMTIGLGTTTAIKISAAKAVVTALAKAIVAKSTTADPIRNSPTNKRDELGEVAAFMVGHMLNAATIGGANGGRPQVTAKNAGAKILGVILGAVNAAKGAKVASANGASFYGNTAADVAGSVAETLERMQAAGTITTEFYNEVKTFLLKKASAIGGKTNGFAVQAAMDAGFLVGVDAGGPNGEARFEIGTVANTNEAKIADPETDFKPF
jgi:hypothetical protein